MTSIHRHVALPAALCAVTLALAASVAQGSSPTAAVAAGATGASGATGPGVLPTALQASLSACHPDAAPSNRYAIFAAQTTAAGVRGTVEMSVDFVLQERGVGAGSAVTSWL